MIIKFKETNDLSVLSNLYQRYMDLVYGVCLKYYKDAEQSKDAVMEIFEELCKKLPQHDIDNFRGWLHVLTRNHCLMQLRSSKNIKITEFDATFMQNEEKVHLDNEYLQKEQQFKLLENCLQTLPDEQKQSVALFYLKNKCYNEIAEITGYDWNKVRSYIQNGRRNLKLCMDENDIQLKKHE